MLKRQVTYKNPFTDEDVVEDLYFHINLAEATQMEMYENLSDTLEALGKLDPETKEGKRETYRIFEWLVQRAYGVRHSDGINFLKNEAIQKDFMKSLAYSEILEWLLFDDKATDNASAFINGLLPDTLLSEARKRVGGDDITDTDASKPTITPRRSRFDDLSPEE